MKFIGGLFRFLFSFVFSVVTVILIVAFAVIQPLSTALDSKHFESTIAEGISGAITESIIDENSSIMTELNESLAKYGVKKETIDQLIECEDVKKVIDDFSASVAKKVTGTAEDVELPSKDTIADIIINHADELGLKNVDESKKAELIEKMGKAYDDAAQVLNTVIEQMDVPNAQELINQLLGGDK